jgi:Single-strand binding protein family
LRVRYGGSKARRMASRPDRVEAIERSTGVIAFGKLADTCQQFLNKGRQVCVEGRLTTNSTLMSFLSQDSHGTLKGSVAVYSESRHSCQHSV